MISISCCYNKGGNAFVSVRGVVECNGVSCNGVSCNGVSCNGVSRTEYRVTGAYVVVV